MYLKALELFGFKSFAAKTVLEFHRGVTAIVGPNGCGKSNVLDAIRWVLGEQSAKALRGGEMADVIFGGTDSRQPLGMGEVSMTFADCEKELGVEWNEVRITRRVFRDGKSEYFINKAPCRLRDIHELFMDTGIGRSAYSIMEQGKIDQILSSRPDDRRAIFEEAAGITKYKAQKREALRKLEHTEANLVRVADIIREVKRQITSLQRQAGKARRYKGIAESLRVFDTHLAHRNFSELGAELDGVRADLASCESSKSSREQLLEQQENEALALRAGIADIESEINATRQALQEIRNRILSAENRIESHGHRCQEFTSLIERNEGEIAAAREKIREQESAIVQTDSLIGELLATLRSGEEALRTRESSARALREQRENRERDLSKASAESSRIDAQINHLRGERSNTEGRREVSESRLSSLRTEEAAFGDALAAITSRMEETRARISTISEAVEQAAQAIQAHSAELDAAESERLATLESRRTAERSLAEASSKLEILRRYEASGEGLGAATKALLKGLDNPDFFTPAIIGSLASLLDVDEKFARAIGAAMGETLGAVLFKDEEIASTALQALATGDHGRGTLAARPFPLPSSPANRQPLPEGALAWATDCLQSPDDLRPLLASLLSGIAIAPDLETAFRLSRMRPGIGFATLSGEFVSPSGLATAGNSVEQSGETLLRKHEIAALDAAAERARGECEAARLREESASAECAAIASSIEEARQSRQSLHLELSGLRGELSLLEKQAAAEHARHDNLLREIASTESGIAQATERLESFESRLAALASELGQIGIRRIDIEREVSELRAREQEELDALNDARLLVATERQQRENLQRQREPMAARLHELADLLANRSNDIENYRHRIESLEREISELRDGMGAWVAETASLDAALATLLARRSDAVEQAGAIDARLRAERHELQEIRDRAGRLEVRSTQIELRRESLVEHVARRHQIELAAFEPDPYSLVKTLKEFKDSRGEPATETDSTPRELPWDEISSFVAELTGKLDAMGPVNLDAIQEFEELEQRHQFLEQQNSDLSNSKNELLEVISRINKTTRQMFSETFEKIRVNFQEMFGELFGGGRANLVLLDEADPLESGIEIIAKPPGKQLQSISLLSGGEKTMTAVSLLFAIYMVKPSPFCVLDEMDAPLDESNISRFIRILDRFIGQSQFVVITHNKRTISRADLLYGVTMEEHGVSKLVGVRFQENESRREPGAPEPHGHARSVAETFGKSHDLPDRPRDFAEESASS